MRNDLARKASSCCFAFIVSSLAFSQTSPARRIIILLLVCCITYPTSAQQWQTSPGNSNDILNTNSGNVGIGTQPGTYNKLDVNGNIHSNSMFISDVPNPGNVGGWYRGAINGNSNVVLQGGAGNYAAWWLTGGGVFKIGGTGATEPGTGAINVTSGGQVGVGTTSPQTMLDVLTTSALDGFRVRYNSAGWANLNGPSLQYHAFNNIVQNGDAGIIFAPYSGSSTFGFVVAPFTNGPGGLRVDWTGNVLIGKGTQTNSSYMLDVNGSARASQVVVNTTGADFVFDSSYQVPALKDVDAFIRQQHHLPGIAPAAQMQKEGIDLGQNQTRLLQKIEELTLYVIEQNKRIDALSREVKKLKKRK